MHATRLIGRQETDRDRKRRKTQILLLQLTTRYVNRKGEDSSSFFFFFFLRIRTIFRLDDLLSVNLLHHHTR